MSLASMSLVPLMCVLVACDTEGAVPAATCSSPGRGSAEPGSSYCNPDQRASVWRLTPLPLDLSTDVGGGPIGLLVSHQPETVGARPSAVLLAALAANLRVTDANGDRVEGTVEIIAPVQVDSPPSPDESAAEIPNVDQLHFRPAAPWAEEWHTLWLDEVPDGTVHLGFAPRHEEERGLRARFAPFSAPIFQRVVVKTGPDLTYASVSLELSEDVAVEALAAATQVTSPMGACALAWGSAPGPESARGYVYHCPESALPPEQIEVVVTGPLTATSGARVTTLDGRPGFSLTWPGEGWQTGSAGRTFTTVP